MGVHAVTSFLGEDLTELLCVLTVTCFLAWERRSGSSDPICYFNVFPFFFFFAPGTVKSYGDYI